MNKKEELKSATFFIKWLNKNYNFDYEIFPNNDEDNANSEIDIYAKSKFNKFQRLNFQTVESEGKLMKRQADLRKISKKTGKNIVMGGVIDLDSEKWIKEVILKKEKHYPEEIKKTLILLIQKDLGPTFNKEYFKRKFSEYTSFSFRGIYLVHFPSLKENSSYPHDGQVLIVKDFNKTKIQN